MGSRIPVLLVPQELRPVLSAPQGTVFIGDNIEGIEADAGVGDIVSQTLSVKRRIVDYRTRRIKHISPGDLALDTQHIILNPPGSISINAYTIASHTTLGDIVVVGEEDLLPLALIENSSINRIVYGQPGVGVVVVGKTRHSLLRARSLRRAFTPALTEAPRLNLYSVEKV